MAENRARLKDIALGVLFFGILIAALYFVVVVPAQKRSKAGVCYSHFGAILVASRQYAQREGTGYQTNLICLSNDLRIPWILQCVEDQARRWRMEEKGRGRIGTGSAEHWARLTMDDCSYQVFLRDSNALVVRCPIHKIGMQTVGEVNDGIENYRREEKLK